MAIRFLSSQVRLRWRSYLRSRIFRRPTSIKLLFVRTNATVLFAAIPSTDRSLRSFSRQGVWHRLSGRTQGSRPTKPSPTMARTPCLDRCKRLPVRRTSRCRSAKTSFRDANWSPCTPFGWSRTKTRFRPLVVVFSSSRREISSSIRSGTPSSSTHDARRR